MGCHAQSELERVSLAVDYKKKMTNT